MEFTWKSVVKVIVGEFTRAGLFDYYAAVDKLDTDMPEVDYRLATNQLLVLSVPMKLYVCKDGQWHPVTQQETVEAGANVFDLAPAMTEDLFQRLPAGLAKQWVFAADKEQGYLVQNAADFFGVASQIDEQT